MVTFVLTTTFELKMAKNLLRCDW